MVYYVYIEKKKERKKYKPIRRIYIKQKYITHLVDFFYLKNLIIIYNRLQI